MLALAVERCRQPIKFCGVGEKLADLEPFYPSARATRIRYSHLACSHNTHVSLPDAFRRRCADRTAGRILGMGDVVSLVEKAASLRNASEMEEIGRRMMAAEFDLNDFLKQSEMVAQLGSMVSLSRMLPGVSGRVTDKQAAEAETRLRVFRSLIQSMTPAERRTPEARRPRCAASRIISRCLVR